MIAPNSNGPIVPHHDHDAKKMVVIRYKECLKNHAAAVGGKATDGCGEFMPSGEDGTLEAFACSACGCHRNFHRKETEPITSTFGRNNSSYNYNREFCRVESLHPDYARNEGGGRVVLRQPAQFVKKRTKFTQEQKDRMFEFAERAGWRMRKRDEAVQQFCQEVGIKRRALKVWMHNTKQRSLARKNKLIQSNPPPRNE